MALIGPGIRDMFEMERENPASYEGLLATHAKLMLEESFLSSHRYEAATCSNDADNS